VDFDSDEKQLSDKKDLESDKKGSRADVSIQEVEGDNADKPSSAPVIKSVVDIAVNQQLTWESAWKIMISPVTWLPALAYITTFGFELALDAKMADVLWKIYNKNLDGFDQETAGYYTSIFGFLNLVTRPFGGYVGDVVYRKYGTAGKKWWTLICGLLLGVSCMAGGFYLSNNHVPKLPSLAVVMGVFSVAAIFSELGNGANFALVPHCNPYNNGVMSGIVGSFGNVGGIIFALVFRFQTADEGRAFWIMGIICLVLNVVLIPISVPKY